jgi:hypothetical protein
MEAFIYLTGFVAFQRVRDIICTKVVAQSPPAASILNSLGRPLQTHPSNEKGILFTSVKIMKEFKYNKHGKISPGLSGKTGPIAMLLSVLVLSGLILVEGGLASIGGILVIVFFYGVMSFGLSFWSNIKCDKDTLFLEFLGWDIKIPWENILDIKEIRSLPQNVWLVTVKKITMLHYLYGLLFSFRLTPGFLIWESMPNHSDLISHIKRNIKKTRR